MKNTLVTGAGLIGRLTAEMLAARGEMAVLADIRNPNLPQSDLLRFAECDVTDAERFDATMERYDISLIVHTAALLSTSIGHRPCRESMSM